MGDEPPVGEGTAPAQRFDAVYDAAFARLVAQVTALTGDVTESQDVCQEAFVRAWQRWDHVGSLDVPEAWVRRVAFRLAVSRWRRARTRASALLRAGPAPDVPALSPDAVALVAALRRLPGAQREALVLHHVADLPVAEVARATSAPEGTVKARLSRGRTTLAGLLADEPSSSSPAPAPAPARRAQRPTAAGTRPAAPRLPAPIPGGTRART